MGLIPQFSNAPWHHHLSTLLRRFMSQPPPAHVPGLFIGSRYRMETRAWPDLLRDDANLCKLVRLEFCKTRGENLHEFLILYFSHPTHKDARAIVVVDRAAKDRSRPLALASPSIPSQIASEALDMVHIMGQEDDLEAYLTEAYPDKYDKLCILRYSPAGSAPNSMSLAPPSAIQLSTLLLVATRHHPNYDLYEHNCYWYADTIFEACKKLFPVFREECIRHGDRGRCRFNVSMLATHDLPVVCNEYRDEWKKVTQRRQESREMTARQVELEKRLEEERQARKAAEAVRQEWERKLDEERKAVREAVQREWEQKVEEERRATHEAAQLLTEAKRRCEQLQSELYAVRQAPAFLSVQSTRGNAAANVFE